MTTAYISHPDCIKHDMGEGHAESPQRVTAVHEALTSSGLIEKLDSYQANLVTQEQLGRVHDQRYVDKIFATSPKEGRVALDPDTSMNPFSLRAAQLAAGAVVQACDMVMEGKADNAFCNVRPPGHHAEHNRAMGFCIFNSIAVGAAHAIKHHNLSRVAVLDFDVHHGNGTEDIFEDNDKVLLCQTYQSPFYPYTGCDSIDGHIINAALPAGMDSELFRMSIEELWLPQLHQFKPEMLFISAGFDAHEDDPLAQCKLHEDDYAWVTKILLNLAQQYCQGRVVSSLEGGYNLSALGKSALAHVEQLVKAHA
ncbi:histone deacetylase family protein [Agarilytica rhodophyticola]|uniref:histone deacetylase family protein n=1 Tax=Agarilytica rhodophyticola TaxID=1737490 RepID=UPI000B34461E|nr:histone deacetylase family protein [Agarilytica rhodophyticola]